MNILFVYGYRTQCINLLYTLIYLQVKLCTVTYSYLVKLAASDVCKKMSALWRRYLLSVIIFGHFQRPSVAANMRVDEFVKSNTASDGRVVVLVSEHKTSAQGPAQLALEANHHKLFNLYLKRLTFVIFHYMHMIS